MVILAIVLIFLNAFFVLSEFALVKVRKSRLEELVKQNNNVARLALKMSNSLDSYLSATQLGITLSSLALGWCGSYITALILHGMHAIFTTNAQLLDSISLVISFSLVTLLHVILGEIVPKSVAIAKSESAALAIARPLYLFWLIFFPIIKFFDFSSMLFLKLLKVEHHADVHSDEELKIIVGESLKGGVLDSIEGEIIKNAVDFSDTLAREVMTPRKDMICLDKTLSYEKNIEILISGEHHTRYPYCDGSKDNIIGIIHIRDVLAAHIRNNYKPIDSFDDFVKKMLIVGEGASISQVLLKMNKKKVDTALVIDEYGGTAGMLTSQDIMNEIIGSIVNDTTKNSGIKKVDDRTYEVDGKVDLETIKSVTNFEYDEDSTQVTIGGYVLNLFGDMPSVGDIVSDTYCQYEVLAIEDTRIKKLRILITG
ncbi:DUF21 domain-containing protein [Helicobacter saguini]|uniref:DUF21 domain-containing protein n=1 Tax=Helicobacter saguini TaxID=1548018 RepID=A0A347VUC5_9HELI|nr:hemolysin family protein [Helicobacter saguini]MWV62320.1 DUF21 domain-containing protein [Helicobacter saguini]MWV67009.1 DUF21 domain-containing protein [Helicobacter saguini]MWV69357.1 DUF21 domain-containing protein [Helicobacter saguini]MWV71088.1 DUF21 domain-containing protein [Helicobacter saguini]TLD95081.1 HlyC/CorC family transporter [Helicobacter saguini]